MTAPTAAGLALLLASCQDAPPGSCKMARAADVPLQFHHGHLLVDTTLNGSPTKMIVDTGAQRTVITRQAAERLHLSLEEAGYSEGVGGKQNTYQFVATTFQINRLFGRQLPLMASDLGPRGGYGMADGLFGADFLAAYDLDLDLLEHKVILYRRVAGCRVASAYLTGQLYGVPIVSSNDPNDPRPRIHVDVDGKTLLAVVDSGASYTAIFREPAQRVGLRIGDLTQDRHFKAGGIGPSSRTAVRHVLTSVTVGDLTVTNMPAAIVDEDRLGGDDMLLGLDFMSRVHVWFSFSGHTLVMQFPPQASPK